MRRPARRAGASGGPGARPAPRVDRARLAALDVVRAVRVDGAYTNLVLPAVLRHHGLSGRDAAFVTELASGTVRRQGSYDAVLAACVDRRLSKVEAKVLDALRLGVHQLLSMRVPAHAAISTTVDLVRARGNPGAAGFANAVLRRVAEHDLDSWMARVAPDPATAPVEHAATVHSHPVWVVEELRRAVGAEELPALLAADNQPPAVTLVARPGLATRDELPGRPTPLSPYGVVLDGGDPGELAAVAEHRAGVQDEGSQLVAMLLAEAPVSGPDRLWVDLCAGPGGKAALLAALGKQRGARLVAVERQHHRSRLVARATGAVDPGPVVVTADGGAPPLPPASVDRVLVDAPCSGLGALRRRPEARWRRKEDDLLGLVLLQRRLLESALELARPGGVVVYATCSPVTSETEAVVTSVLQSRPDVRLRDATAVLPAIPDCAGPLPGTVQLWPHRHGTDAMFMALLEKG